MSMRHNLSIIVNCGLGSQFVEVISNACHHMIYHIWTTWFFLEVQQ